VDYLKDMGGLQVLVTGLNSDPKKGIKGDRSDLMDREASFGHNRKPEVKPKGLCELLLDALDDFTLKILIVAAIVSIIVEVSTASDDHRSTSWIEGFAILVAVAISSGITAVNDFQKEKQFQKLNLVSDSRKMVNVIRDGKLFPIHQSELVVGDIL